MALNEHLNQRLREALAGVKQVEEKRMFRGLVFMVNGKMCISAGDDHFMFRVDPEMHDKLVQQDGCTTVVMRGRAYRGYIRVKEASISKREQLQQWVTLALAYNKTLLAAASKPAKKRARKPLS